MDSDSNQMKVLPEKTLLTPEEVAKFFGVSKRTVYNWCEAESIKWCKPNGAVRIYRQSVMEAMELAQKKKISKRNRSP